MTFKEFLLDDTGYLGAACDESIDWLGGRTPEQALAYCHRGDWLMWWAEKVGVDRRKLVGCAGHCADTVLELMQDGRSIAGVDAAIAYGEGLISEEELRNYRVRARAAYTAAADAAHAAHAVYAAYTAQAASYTSYTYTTAASASYAADDKEANQAQTAEIVRNMLGDRILELTEAILNEPAGKRLPA